jgi:hypothetical protein
MNGCWKNSYPNAVHFFEGFDISPISTEIAILAKEAGFQDDGEDDIAELLESHFLPLMNKELAKLDLQTYKEAQDDGSDDDNIITEGKTLTNQGLREALSKIDEAMDYFRNHDPLCDHSVNVERELRDVLSCL